MATNLLRQVKAHSRRKEEAGCGFGVQGWASAETSVGQVRKAPLAGDQANTEVRFLLEALRCAACKNTVVFSIRVFFG